MEIDVNLIYNLIEVVKNAYQKSKNIKNKNIQNKEIYYEQTPFLKNLLEKGEKHLEELSEIFNLEDKTIKKK